MTVPCHIAIIMDGNGRWAKERGLWPKEQEQRGVSEEAMHEFRVALGIDDFEYPREYAEKIVNLLRNTQ